MEIVLTIYSMINPKGMIYICFILSLGIYSFEKGEISPVKANGNNAQSGSSVAHHVYCMKPLA